MVMEKSITAQRAEACYEVFKRVLMQCESISEAFERAAREPAPRFFVEFPRAYRCVSELERYGKRVPNTMKAAMYDELHRRWKARGVKHYQVLEEIIEEPAPSFYIAPETFKALVYIVIRDKRRKVKNGKHKKED